MKSTPIPSKWWAWEGSNLEPDGYEPPANQSSDGPASLASHAS